ncbi:hypothetical protein [Brucella sp.]|uniref:hypothetical protein n=1 Tax=Brucella sp. TaxID=52132 RepID=UPI0028B11AD6|nr:hypothetical protein [Brucella sp.]
MNIQDEIANIENENVSSPSQIPFTLFQRPELKTSNLWIDSPSHTGQKGASKPFEFQFRSPDLVTVVVIHLENYSSHDKFDVTWTSLDGGSVTQSYSPNEDKLTFEPNELISKFTFRPPTKLFPGKKIVSVLAEGLDYETLAATLKSHNRISMWKQNVIAQTNQKNKEFLDIQSNIEKQELAKTEALREQARKDLNNREKSLIKANQEYKDAASKTTNEMNILRETAVTISEKQNELKKLKDDINLFPTELTAFATQGNKTARHYGLLAVIPMLVIIGMATNLIWGADNLKDAAWGKPLSEVVAALVSRGPYVTLSLATIAACYGLAHFLLSEIVKINRQKLILSKLSIIATDVSKTAAIDFRELNEEELFEKRVEFKMILLRDHLKTHISDDLSFKFPRIRFLENKFFGTEKDNS